MARGERRKIEEYIKAFDTVNRYGLKNEDNKPSAEEVDKAMLVIADSEQFLSSDAGDGRTVYQCMMDQYKEVLRKRHPRDSEQQFEDRFTRYVNGAERDLQEAFNLLDVNCDLQKTKKLKKKRRSRRNRSI